MQPVIISTQKLFNSKEQGLYICIHTRLHLLDPITGSHIV